MRFRDLRFDLRFDVKDLRFEVKDWDLRLGFGAWDLNLNTERFEIWPLGFDLRFANDCSIYTASQKNMQTLKRYECQAKPANCC